MRDNHTEREREREREREKLGVEKKRIMLNEWIRTKYKEKNHTHTHTHTHTERSLNKFPDFFRMGGFIDRTHIKF